MKIKIAVCAVMALLFAPAVSQARWGTEFTGQSWKMDGKEFLTDMQTFVKYAQNHGYGMAGKLTQEKIGGAAGFFVEGNSRFRLGISAGYGVMPSVSVKAGLTTNHIEREVIENKTTYIPADLYLKYTSKGGKFSLFGGGGGDYVMASTDFKFEESGGYTDLIKGTFTQKKVIPHVQAGCELFLAKWISLNISAKYLFSAILDDLTGNVTENGVALGKRKLTMMTAPTGEVVYYSGNTLSQSERPLKYDFSGLRANVALRIYFH